MSEDTPDSVGGFRFIALCVVIMALELNEATTAPFELKAWESDP